MWSDVVDDRRGSAPLDATQVLGPKHKRDFAADSIGLLTQPVDLVAWERRVRERFGFLADLDDQERRWASCDPRHRHEVELAILGGGFAG